MEAKLVNKPWGLEKWLAYPPEFPYVMKQIITFAPHRSSLHYHVKKQETNFVISGKGKVLTKKLNEMPCDESEMDCQKIGPNSVFSIGPNVAHRVIAIESLVTIEVSTPEVDDVIRLQDDNNRGNGRIESEHGV